MDKLSPEALGQKVTHIPEKNSAQWRKNESMIAKNPQLRRMRDIQQGFKPTSSISVSDNSQQYKDGWDRIWGNKDIKDKDVNSTQIRSKKT